MSAENAILKINFAILAAPALLASQKKSQAIEINAVNSLFVYFSFFENNAINLLFVCLFFMNLINFKYTIIIIA